MGCDGGTIPRRDELVRTKQKPESKDKDSERSFHWKCCAITQQTLQEPIVVCGLGKLYSKVSAIEGLLSRDTLPETAKHIKSLKDVKNLNLTPNPEYKADADKKGDNSDTSNAPYICPVIGLEMSGKFKFVALWTCGCVFSERALKEISTKVCHKCQTPFEEDDVVIINPVDDDLDTMKGRLELRQLKNKKNKEKKIKIKNEPSETITKPNVINLPSTSKTGATKLLPTKRNGAVIQAKNDDRIKKSKMDYSVAKDPNATDVYKSLFTTHKSEKEQERAHWITYNPFYN